MWILIFFWEKRDLDIHIKRSLTMKQGTLKKKKKKVFIEYCQQIVFCCQDQVVGDPGSM